MNAQKENKPGIDESDSVGGYLFSDLHTEDTCWGVCELINCLHTYWQEGGRQGGGIGRGRRRGWEIGGGEEEEWEEKKDEDGEKDEKSKGNGWQELYIPSGAYISAICMHYGTYQLRWREILYPSQIVQGWTHWTGAEHVYTGPEGAPANTVLRNPSSSYKYTADYYSCCSWSVHNGNKIGGVLQMRTRQKKHLYPYAWKT